MKINSDSKKQTTAIITGIGLISSIFSFFTTSFTKVSIILGLGILLLTAIIVLIITRKIAKGSFPDGMEEVADEIENGGSNQPNIKVVFPCDEYFYNAANKLAREKFGKNSVSRKKVNDWKKRNEYILSCLIDKDRMVGYFDILPLKSEFAKNLILGNVGENDISAENILAFHEMEKAEYIYIAGIAVKHTDTGKGYIHGTYLIASAAQYIKKFYQIGKLKKIITIPTSECGLKITKHLNFKLEREGGLRKDGYDLYSKDFNAEEINQLIESKKEIFTRFDLSAYNI
jgi:hypothetical protein